MIKVLHTLCYLSLCILVYAAPGDTVLLSSHDAVVIQTDPGVGHTDYGGWIDVPTDRTYRRIVATLTFSCAPGLKCGEWDYLNYIYIGRRGGDSSTDIPIEIARYITPYGFYWHADDNWAHQWTFDMTDWAYLLKDSVEIIYRHTGYENVSDRGWTIDLDFHFIEGNPVRQPLGITPLWVGSYTYGNAADPIENHLTTRSVDLHPETEQIDLYILQTGHGADNGDQCSEFCAKSRTLQMNGTSFDEKQLWRRCGNISLYPQAGTWLLDRGNWCPGDLVYPDIYHLTVPPGDTSVDFDMAMEAYTATENHGNWVISSYAMEYGPITAEHDAAVYRIHSPSTNVEDRRYNPRCNEAVIEIQNLGSEPLTSLEIEYGIDGSTSHYSWTGNLAFGERTKVTLYNASDWRVDQPTTFVVRLTDPNGQADAYPLDNTASSTILPVPEFPADFIVRFQSTKAQNETRYQIVDASSGDIVFSRQDFEAQKLHFDTIHLEHDHCYIFRIIDDGTPLPGGIDVNSDGMQFWYWTALVNNYPQYAQYIDNAAGYVRLYRADLPFLLTDLTPNRALSTATINGADFGAMKEVSFVTEKGSSIDETIASESMSIYPNPTSDVIHIRLPEAWIGQAQARLETSDGRVVMTSRPLLSRDTELDVSAMRPAIYILVVQVNDQLLRHKIVVTD